MTWLKKQRWLKSKFNRSYQEKFAAPSNSSFSFLRIKCTWKLLVNVLWYCRRFFLKSNFILITIWVSQIAHVQIIFSFREDHHQNWPRKVHRTLSRLSYYCIFKELFSITHFEFGGEDWYATRLHNIKNGVQTKANALWFTSFVTVDNAARKRLRCFSSK